MRHAPLIALVAALTLCGGTSPASAELDSGPPSSDGAVATSEGAQQAQVSMCSLYANSAGFGMSCLGGDGSVGSLKAVLGGDPFPACWDEVPPAGFVPPAPADGPGAWWIETCVKGIDPETLKRTGPVLLEQRPVFLAPGAERFLTVNQRNLIASVQQETYPVPLLAMGPSSSPRVNTDVYFWVVPGRARTVERRVVLPAGTVSMRATIVQTAVQPTGPAGPTARCAGRGVEVHAVTDPERVPGACHHRYRHSSARASGGEYAMPVTAYWRVEYSTGGAWTELGTFPVNTVQRLRVTEIQTLVVS
ncbi:MAG: hypothetical protein JWN54_3042 [Mycobacterium sp.]|nr:hypothetical protein [Mycobacterium sp.]